MSSYGDIFMSALYPLYESALRGRGTLGHYRSLKKSQWCSRDELVHQQFGALKKLLHHAYEQVPFYAKMFRALGATPDDIKDHGDFAKLPTLDKDTILANRSDLVARDHVGRTLPKTTGGSTGQPLRFEYTRESYEWRVATRMRGYGWAGCREGEKVAHIWGVPIDEPTGRQRVKEWLYNGVRRWKYFNCFALDDRMAADVCRQLTRFRPTAVVAYATPIYNLAVSLREQGLKPPRIASVLTAAEKIQDFQRATVEEVFGCKVFNTYGCREFMLIASECEAHEGLHINMENLCVEILHNAANLDPNGPGEVVVTDLHNYGMPFIRYRSGDLGIPSRRERCSCGRGLTLMEDVQGRLLDTILTPEGHMVPGEFFPHLAKEFDEISKFQVVQEEIDRLVIKVVRSREFAGDSLSKFKSEVAKVVGTTITLDVQFVDDIPLTPTGKSRVTISNVWRDRRRRPR